jgi:transcriptional regulator with XRE-family HTH domain
LLGKLRSMLGKYIRLQRLMRNLKQEHVAEKAGIDQSSYSRIERDQIDPSWSRVKKIAEGIGCRIRDFDPDEGEEKDEAGQRP